MTLYVRQFESDVRLTSFLARDMLTSGGPILLNAYSVPVRRRKAKIVTSLAADDSNFRITTQPRLVIGNAVSALASATQHRSGVATANTVYTADVTMPEGANELVVTLQTFGQVAGWAEVYWYGNSLDVELTSRKIALPAMASYDQALSVPAGGSVSIGITPPAGELWRLKLLYLFFPAVTGATTGTQIMKVRLGLNNDYGNILRNEVAYNTPSELFYNIWAGGTKKPASDAEQQRAVLNAVVSNTAPLYVMYDNNTDVAQTGTAIIRLLREVEYIVS